MSAVIRALSAVRIFVDDLARAQHFYGDVLGLTQSASGPGYVVFELGGASVVIEAPARDDPERGELVGRFLSVSFSCAADIDSTYRRLIERGVVFLQPPEEQPWGGTLAFLRDPAGNVLTLVG